MSKLEIFKVHQERDFRKLTCLATDSRRALEGTLLGEGLSGSKGSTKFSNKALMASSVGQAGKEQSASSIISIPKRQRFTASKFVARREVKVEIFFVNFD